MAPTDRFKLPLRWQFIPEAAKDGSIRWRWRAFTQTGDLAVWLMAGTGVLQAPVIAPAVPLAWEIQKLVRNTTEIPH